MTRASRFSFLAVVAIAAAGTTHASGREAETQKGIALAELATLAGVIVLAQVRDTDYVYRREFPVAGSAFLRVLIPYKASQPMDIIEVYEAGLHAHECYFPTPTVFEEGRRYLLFLQEDAEKPGRYRGLPQGCALDILVAQDNSYVLRLPVTGIELTDSLDAYRQSFEFSDSYAVETDESLNPQQREALMAGAWIMPRGMEYLYTSGVSLSVVRQLMRTGNQHQ
ncbi:MAG TPA: hypothetical protein VI566_00785 [Xanthomonadales bacterium]|nr:hypothetical protein [Xanthomonadales bacterium]